jgi:hypothetical protein
MSHGLGIKTHSRNILGLFEPPETVQTYEKADNAECIKVHLKADLKFNGSQIKKNRIGKSQPQRNKICRKKSFYDIPVSGDKSAQ